MKFIALILAAALLLQSPRPSAPGLLHVGRALTVQEIDVVLIAAKTALEGKTFRLAPWNGSAGAEVLIGADARPKVVRSTSTIEGGLVIGVGGATPPAETRWREEETYVTTYTGRPARLCNGSGEGGELVIVYARRATAPSWTVTARQRDARDDRDHLAQALAMLRDGHALGSGPAQMIDGRYGRAFTAAYVPPASNAWPAKTTGDPAPNVAGEPIRTPMTETLWIDGESLLPLRWEVSRRAVHVVGYDFRYADIDLQPPVGVATPDCVR